MLVIHTASEQMIREVPTEERLAQKDGRREDKDGEMGEEM